MTQAGGPKAHLSISLTNLYSETGCKAMLGATCLKPEENLSSHALKQLAKGALLTAKAPACHFWIEMDCTGKSAGMCPTANKQNNSY